MSLAGNDCLCIIDRNAVPNELKATFEEHRKFDKSFDSSISCFKVPNVDQPVVYAPVSELTDYDDVRSYQEAAKRSMEKVLKVGFFFLYILCELWKKMYMYSLPGWIPHAVAVCAQG